MANRPSAKQTTAINRSNQDIALELSKAALAGGALTAVTATQDGSKLAERARVEASYIAALYKSTLTRLERLEASENASKL